jgi:CSLREA domain-containing protein
LSPHPLRAAATAFVAAVAVIAGAAAAPSEAATFVVDATADATDASPGDGACATAGGKCSLRAAVMEANAGAGADSIEFVTGLASGPLRRVHALSLTGSGEDAAATGDLDITDDLTIAGRGRRNTIIDGGRIDRVLHIGPAAAVTVAISGVTIRGGRLSSLQAGAGIDHEAGTLTLRDTTITGNDGGALGGALFNRATASLSDVALSDNRALDGGGVDNEGDLRLADVTIDGNGVTNGAGGIANFGSAGGERVTLSGNSASHGGALYNAAGGRLELTNATVSGNEATHAGGGVWNGGTATFTATTFAGNRAAAGQGGAIANFDSLTLDHAIVADSQGGNCAGAISSRGHNLDSGATCGLGGAGDLSGVDPRLGPLTQWIGRTPTHALAAGSPALDVGGACPASDQRGVARPQGGACDIGAYELQSDGLVVDSTRDLPDLHPGDGVCDAGRRQCTLRAAVMEANALPGADLIRFAVNGVFALNRQGSSEDYAATGDLDVRDDLTVTGNDRAQTVVDAGGAQLGDRILDVDPAGAGVSVSISGLTLSNARPPALDEGAAILHGHSYFGEPARLRLADVTVSSNTAQGVAFAAGGGIASYGTLELEQVELSGNAATVGGGLAVRNLATATLTHVTASGNNAVEEGGGVLTSAEAIVAIVDGTLAANTAARGAGLINQPDGTTSLRDSVLRDNVAGATGGGALNRGTLTATDTTFADNAAQGQAGGGGIYNQAGADAELDRVTVARNSAWLRGGGVVNYGRLSAVNSTLSANSATLGAALSALGTAANPASTRLTHVTVAANTGGGVANAPAYSTLELANTILADSASGPNCTGTVNSGGSNLDSGTSCGLTAAGDQSATNPLLAALATNGARTPTHAVQAGSPAIDAADRANCPDSDQRGVPRPQGAGCDIGAYERRRREAP